MKSHRLSTLALVGLCGLVRAPIAQAADAYIQHNLVSDGTIPADHVDANLVNAWGIALSPTSFAWVADNGTGVSTLYDGMGNPQSLVVTIPPPPNGTPPSKP